MANERIKLDMMADVIMVVSGGSPEAMSVCIEILKNGDKIDPDLFAGGLGSLLMLDTLGIYGSRLYMLWNDVCKRSVGRMIAVLRANQLGQLAGVDSKTLNHAIDNCGVGINLDAVVEAVKNRLPNFNPEVA